VRLLVDEGVPIQALEPLRRNKGHEFDHVTELQWSGRLDVPLFQRAVKREYDGIIAVDVNQLAEPAEWRALKASKLHHISVGQGRTVRGAKGLARVLASLIVAMPYVLDELAEVDSQRIVEISLLSAAARHESYDPRREKARYPYWR
jgi:hypothetical protein